MLSFFLWTGGISTSWAPWMMCFSSSRHTVSLSLKLEGTFGDCPNPIVHLAPQQDQLEKVAQDCATSDFECIQRWTLHSFSRQAVPDCSHPDSKMLLLCLSGISCVSACVHCLLSCNPAPLRRIWLPLYLCLISYPCTWLRFPRIIFPQAEWPQQCMWPLVWQILQPLNYLHNILLDPQQ